jgi:hypothetical protein
LECLREIMSQRGIDCVRIAFRLEDRLINADEFLPLARIFPEAVVSDTVKPGGKFRFAAKAADVFISLNERLLREIVGQGEIVARELAEQTAHDRLMTAHEFSEGMVIILKKNSCDKVGIG